MERLIVLGMFALILAMVSTSSPSIASGSSCEDVNTKLGPCLSYTKGTGEPTKACCGGVKELNDLVKNNADLADICNCIKAELPKIGNPTPSRIANLTKSCGVNRDFPPIDKNYNCSKISD